MINFSEIKKLVYCSVVVAGSTVLGHAQKKPNIIVIMADDMGYSDLGCYGGEVETPHLDKLAKNGLRYKQFYNSARSCPSRATLMTGLYPHQAGMGWMAAADMGRPAYQGYLNRESVTIAEVLSTSGYSTYMTGKWHLSSDRQNAGKVKEYWPNQRGFDHFFGIVGGASNYFNMTYNINNEQFNSRDDDSFYFTHAISDTATTYIDQHNYKEKPLFLYVAYTAPHWPLHALPKDIDKYVERYRVGWNKLREERFERQKKIGLFHAGVTLSPDDETIDTWESLNLSQKEEFVMRMAIYAAQIDAMDQGIGRILAKLEEKGQLDNTLVMFMSDNGACAEFISRGKNKELDGRADSYESYRINWANLSSTPYREYKHYTHEGGIASPLIVYYPNGIKKELNNTFIEEYGHFSDVMATCIDVSGAVYPENFNGNTIRPLEGTSLTPNFKGERTGRKYTFWEHEANIAMRDGKWKIVSKTKENTPFDATTIELYDMEADPTELNDLSRVYPEKRAEMIKKWRAWAESNQVLPMVSHDYNRRVNTYKRNIINGEFDDNFGHWQTYTRKSDADVTFSIDEVNTLSGNKTARIDVHRQGSRPNAAFLKWSFSTTKDNSDLSISFLGKADKSSTLFVRVEKIDNITEKPLDKKVNLKRDAIHYSYEGINLPERGNYQLVFYMGRATGSNWIDDVKLNLK